MSRRPHQPAAHLPPEEQDRLLHYVPLLVRSGVVSDWERRFCISLAGRAKRGPVMLSAKQAPILRRLVDRFLEDINRDEVVE